MAGKRGMRKDPIPGRQLDYLQTYISKVLILEGDMRDPPRASSTWPDLSVPSGNVKDTISLYLGNLT